MSNPSPILPRTRNMYFDKDRAQDDPAGHLQDVVNDMSKMYTEIAIAHNTSPQVVKQATQPTPAPGQIMVWASQSDNKTYLLVNTGGVIKKTEMT